MTFNLGLTLVYRWSIITVDLSVEDITLEWIMVNFNIGTESKFETGGRKTNIVSVVLDD